MSIQFFSDSLNLAYEIIRRELTFREAAGICHLSPTTMRRLCVYDRPITLAVAGKLKTSFGGRVVKQIHMDGEFFDQTEPQKFSRVYTEQTEESLRAVVTNLMQETDNGTAIVSVTFSDKPNLDGRYSAVVVFKITPPVDFEYGASRPPLKGAESMENKEQATEIKEQATIRYPDGMAETVELSTEKATTLRSDNREVILQAWLSKEKVEG